MRARFSGPRQGRHRIVRQLIDADKKLLILRMNQKRNLEISTNNARISMKTKHRLWRLTIEAGMSMKTHIVSLKMAEFY